MFKKHFLHFDRLKYGLRQIKPGAISPPVFPDLLESLRCHRTDEYPVISGEDETPIPPLACSFNRASNSAHILALVDENGSVVLYNTNKAGDDAYLTDWTAHNNAIFDVKWTCGEQKLLTASGDQVACLWDVKTKAKLLTFKGHTSSVRSVSFRQQDDAVFASGSRDGHVRIWDVRCNVKESKVSSVSVIRNAHTVPLLGNNRKKSRQGLAPTQDSQQSVTCVVFQDDHLLATGGAGDGCVKVWDTRKLKPDSASTIYQFPYAGLSRRTHGFSSLTFDSYRSRLFASCTDDIIYCYNFISYGQQPVCTYKGHRNGSFYVKAVVSPDNQFLLSGSCDENAYIWQVDNPNASPVILKGHRSEISDVAWCKTDLFRIVTTSDDNTMRVWRYDPTAQIRKQLGQTDKMYEITGYAERTHKDIGTSAESSSSTTAAVSPKPSLKRAATYPSGPVTEVTPKRSKPSSSASPSPSIKMWLKRSSSDSPGPSGVSGPKQLKLGTSGIGNNKDKDTKGTLSSVKNNDSVLNMKTNCTNEDESSSTVVKHSALAENQVEEKRPTKSCKRKLEVDENEDSVKRVRIESHTSRLNTESKQENISTLIESKCSNKNSENSIDKKTKTEKSMNSASPKKHKGYTSPRKQETALQDLSSVINSSPIKGELKRPDISSPAAARVLDLSKKSVMQSPTANLPNFVLDSSNFFLKTTPKKGVDKKKKIDWLTEMKVQKMAKEGSPKARKSSAKLLDTNEHNDGLSSSQERDKPSTPKAKSPVRGIKPITSFFRRSTYAS